MSGNEKTRKIVWITGASSGIGRQTALEMATRGWLVVASARSDGDLHTLAQDVADKGLPGKVVPMPVDVTDLAALQAVVEKIETTLGPLDTALLNAGTFKKDSALTFSAETFGKTIDVNVMGTAKCLEAVLPGFIKRRAGQIVIVSSVAGYRGLAYSLAYGSSKAALINLAEALKCELDAYGVKVQLVCPGFVKTPLTDKNEFEMPMLMAVEPAAKALVDGLEGNRFEIRFPWLFTFIMKRLRCLHDALYFALIKKGLGTDKPDDKPDTQKDAA